MIKTYAVGACFLGLFAFALPTGTQAQQFILDTGTPSGSAFPVLSNTEWFAAEFYATAGETVTDLSVYLTSMTGNGTNFTFDIFSDGGGTFLTTRNAQLGPLLAYTAVGTYAAQGWNATVVDWVVPSAGDYWLAIEENSTATHNKPTFDVQQEASAGTGTVPALAFAGSSGTQFTTNNAVPIGLEVTASVVPEPAGWWFLAAGGIVVGGLRGGLPRLARPLAR